MSIEADYGTGESWDAVRALDTTFAETFERMAAVPRNSSHLDAKTKALIGLAVDANVTHLNADGMRAQIRAAVAAGASSAELMAVLECAATVSIHAMNVGVPVLLSVLRERGEPPPGTDLTDRQRALQADFTRRRGYWNATWDELLRVAPDMFEAYTDYSAHPWGMAELSPLTMELIYIAFDTSATHLYEVGLRLHIKNALEYGADPRQIVEVMEIASLIGVKSVLVGAPMIQQAISK